MPREDLIMLDLRPEMVEIEISAESVVWINVDGLCRLRAQGAKTIIINDGRQHEAEE